MTKNKRIGELRTMNNGMSATIIAYRSNEDMDIQFEDGQVREHVYYAAFARGKVAHPSNAKDTSRGATRIGEKRTMNNGMEATIIAYRSCTDIDVRFEDGLIKKGVQYGRFFKGEVAHSTISATTRRIDHVRENRRMQNGMKATIIAYRSYEDMDIQFEDGQVREHVRYGAFVKGKIAHPDNARCTSGGANRIDETRTMNNGMEATIIAYRSYHDVDVQFEDGKVKENVHYLNFSRGEVAHPIKSTVSKETARLGETRLMNNGMEATIIAYRSSSDIDVRFKDDLIKKGVQYDNFLKGHIAHSESSAVATRTDRVGETRTMRNGMEATIIAYRSALDIDVRFKDGLIKKGVKYDNFLKGRIAHSESSVIAARTDRVGETRTMNNSMKATIIAYRSRNDMDIQFEDGTVKEGVLYGSFLRGHISRPTK